MPTVPGESLDFALLLILAHFCFQLHRSCELQGGQAQSPMRKTG